MNYFLTLFSILTVTLATMISPSLYDANIKMKDIDGNAIDFKVFKGKKLLIVNVASECGYTPQYKDLQALYEAHKDDLMIIGVPCNQFGGQEPGSAMQIKSFCEQNYGVKFLITEKVDVKGDNQHPLYSWLTSKSKNGKLDSEVKWNFNKYLLSETGELLEYFPSRTKPLGEEIAEYLK